MQTLTDKLKSSLGLYFFLQLQTQQQAHTIASTSKTPPMTEAMTIIAN